MKLGAVVLVFILLGIGAIHAQQAPAVENPTIKQSLTQPFTVELFPNPTVDFLNISISDTEVKNLQFEIYSVIGNKQDFEVEKQDNTSYKINVEALNTGYYLIVIKDPISRIDKAYKFRKF